MLDIVALWLLLTSLLLADPGQKNFDVHHIDTNEGLGVTFHVERLPDGFAVTQGTDRMTFRKDPKKPAVYEALLPGGDKARLDMGALSVKDDEARIADKEKHVALGLKMGGAWYVMLKGSPGVLAVPGPTAGPAVTVASLERLTGTLRWNKGPATMTVQNFKQGEFSLETGTGSVTLVPTEAVLKAELERWAGKKVEVSGARRAAPAPRRDEQYPMGPDGAPLARDPLFEVRTIGPAAK
jgi:hypothetical protein